ncbi:serine hydrolase [Synechococcus sp. RSCCF101]|uniref:serine hydrolase n=1 Tax=Synechococcus sp. RSCCF101 TaxID=2511069 RepID=UPI001CDA485E|nr:serine hydrolase [Synechococcus sp. RSCCF101]
MSRSSSPRAAAGWGRPFRLVLRLAVLGVGLGVLTGSGLKLMAPHWQARSGADAGSTDAGQGNEPQTVRALPEGLPSGRFETSSELSAISERWRTLAAAQPDLKASGFLLILDDGRYAQLAAGEPRSAASSIKTPILLAALEGIDAGSQRWDAPLTMDQEVIGGGAGWMASKPVGTRFPLHEAATEMIRVSDNTATNLVIRAAGGQEAVNRRFQDLGLTATVVNNWLPDLEGTNTTSTRDLARTLALVDTGERLSPRARDLFKEVMATSRTNTLLPAGLLKGLGGGGGNVDDALMAKGVSVYNKTGDIGIAYADAGLIHLPDGRRAVAAFMVEGPFNDPRSTDLIRAMAAAMAPTLMQAPQ